MYTEARKLYIIEAVLKTNNDAILKALETIVEGDLTTSLSKKPKANFLRPGDRLFLFAVSVHS